MQAWDQTWVTSCRVPVLESLRIGTVKERICSWKTDPQFAQVCLSLTTSVVLPIICASVRSRCVVRGSRIVGRMRKGGSGRIWRDLTSIRWSCWGSVGPRACPIVWAATGLLTLCAHMLSSVGNECLPFPPVPPIATSSWQPAQNRCCSSNKRHR